MNFSKSNSQSPIYSPIPPHDRSDSANQFSGINYTAQVSPLPDVPKEYQVNQNQPSLVNSQIQNALLQVKQFQEQWSAQQQLQMMMSAQKEAMVSNNNNN